MPVAQEHFRNRDTRSTGKEPGKNCNKRGNNLSSEHCNIVPILKTFVLWLTNKSSIMRIDTYRSPLSVKLILPLLLATPGMAEEPEVDCCTGGSDLYEQSMCKDQMLAELRQKLKRHLSPKEVGKFDMYAVKVCQVAWKPTMQVLIFPVLARNLVQRLKEGLLEEVESAFAFIRGSGCADSP